MKKKYILSIMLSALAIAGCKKSLDQSVNPNSPSVASPQNVLSAAQEVTAVRTNTDFTTFGIWLGYYAPSGNYVPVQNTETYTFTNSSFNEFNPFFSNLSNYNYLILQAGANSSLNYFAAISKVMTAFDYQILVDEYNDVPYTQALNSAQFLFPAYDSGAAIYADLLIQMDNAIALINSSGSAINPGASDVIFGGNMVSWKKFANTMKLKLAIRQSNLFNANAALKASLTAELAKTSSEGYLDDVTFAQVQPGFLSSDSNNGQQTPYYRANGFTAAGAETTGHATNRGNSFFINFELSHGNDSLRLKRIYAPAYSVAENTANATKYAANPSATPAAPSDVTHIRGNTFGADATNTTNTSTSALGPGIIPGATAPAVVLAGSEACYLISEGLVWQILPASVGTAQDYYQRGITANFVALGVPSAATAAATYYNQLGVVDVNWGASSASQTTQQSAIMTQKYIALFGYEIFEEYCEFRRTGFPNLQGARSALGGALGTGPVPNRIYFPLTETQTNAASVAAEPAINPFVSKIFWAK